ncbi:GGDEF domain-containing protein [Trinickia violacea]|uniref:diguanylate cyclase n=1 Tax=Trinickia violacea TaxID=2571746 RepID=A0A4P8ISM3_9BURK|nr:GGDEF domain-containing protein [Trinickia violacea]QCP51386.1 GGDEF domain-containing protein [Trinickia violacea]
MLSPVGLIGIAILSCVISMAVFGSLLKAAIPGLARWFTAYGLVTVALVVLELRGHERENFAAMGASALLLIGALLMLQGCRQFFGRPPVHGLELAGVGAVLVGLVYWTFVAPNLSARVTMMSLYFAYARLAIAWMAYRYRPLHRPQYSYLFVAITALAGAIFHVARGLAYFTGLSHQTVFFEPSPLNIAFLALGILTLPFLSIGMVMLAHDRLAERMERLATIDELTGALVRRAFIARVETLLAAACAGKRKLSLAILDIDHFKAVNDQHGHAVGDHTLAHFVSLLSQGIRRTDVIGRLGGEEFAILFVSAGKAEAARLVDQLRTTVTASPAPAGSSAIACSFSAGVDEFGDGDTLTAVLARADAALYAAKAMGRNCVVVAPSPEGLSVECMEAD